MMRLFICFQRRGSDATQCVSLTPKPRRMGIAGGTTTATTATLELIFWSSADLFSGEDKTHLTLR